MNKHAFTFIEVLTTVVLMLVALIPLMTIVPQMIQNSLKAERLLTVVFLAEQKMEEVKRDVVNSFGVSRDEATTAFNSPHAAYKYTVADNEGASLKEIRVDAWHDEDADSVLDSGEVSIRIDAIIRDRG